MDISLLDNLQRELFDWILNLSILASYIKIRLQLENIFKFFLNIGFVFVKHVRIIDIKRKSLEIVEEFSLYIKESFYQSLRTVDR